MAFPFHNKIHIILLFLTIMCASNAAEKPKVITADFIRSICHKARNATDCSDLLSDDTGKSIQEVLDDLLQFTDNCIVLTLAQLNQTVGDVKNKDHVSYKRYKSCIANYESAGTDIREATSILASKTANHKNLPSKISDSMKKVETKISDSMKKVENCDKAFDQPPIMDPSIKMMNSAYQSTANILLLLSNSLGDN